MRLINADGENVGVVSIAEAKRIARDAELDLVEVAPTANPPVCRVMDYGKFVFEQKKQKQAAKKKQKQVHIKEVKFRPGTGEGDYQVKLRNLIRFLENGDRGKITIRFRGREMDYPEIALEDLKEIAQELSDVSTVEQAPQMEGRTMLVILTPSKGGGK